jgi:MFS family permease
MLLAAGAEGIFISALGRKYGKRPFFVMSSIISTIGCIICETASGYTGLLVGRILQGLSVAAYESLAVSLIGDIFFVHERGPRVAMILFILAAISNGVSIIAGVITERLGWNYNFHILLPFVALQTILVIFYCPETCYRRKAIYEIDTVGSDENLDKLANYEERQRHAHGGAKVADTRTEFADVEKTVTRQTTIESIPPKKTYWQELALYNGTFVEDSVWKMVLACLCMFFNLGALYQVLSTGLIIAWYVGVAIGSGVVLALPPFLLSPSTIGYMSAGPLIGGFLASFLLFFTTEPLMKWIVRRNKGIYEPEFHLALVSVGGVCTVTGLIGWGYSVNNGQSIYLICFCWGLMLFGMTSIATNCTSWALDAFRQYSTEIFVLNMVFKNFFFYG